MFLDGWMGGCKSSFKDCLQQSTYWVSNLKLLFNSAVSLNRSPSLASPLTLLALKVLLNTAQKVWFRAVKKLVILKSKSVILQDSLVSHLKSVIMNGGIKPSTKHFTCQIYKNIIVIEMERRNFF